MYVYSYVAILKKTRVSIEKCSLRYLLLYYSCVVATLLLSEAVSFFTYYLENSCLFYLTFFYIENNCTTTGPTGLDIYAYSAVILAVLCANCEIMSTSYDSNSTISRISHML